MKNSEQYVSLYDYTGKGSRATGLGKKIYEAAKEKGIHVIYTDIPEERQHPEYNRVATYPKAFLDEYFGKTSESDITVEYVHQKLLELKEQFDQLVAKLEPNVTNSVESDDDDLPF